MNCMGVAWARWTGVLAALCAGPDSPFQVRLQPGASLLRAVLAGGGFPGGPIPVNELDRVNRS